MSEFLESAKAMIGAASEFPRTASEQDRWLERGSHLALVALADAVEQLVETIKAQAPASPSGRVLGYLPIEYGVVLPQTKAEASLIGKPGDTMGEIREVSAHD